MQNEYCDLIDTICLEVIPEYKVTVRLSLKGKYGGSTQLVRTPDLSLKLNFTIKRTPNANS